MNISDKNMEQHLFRRIRQKVPDVGGLVMLKKNSIEAPESKKSGSKKTLGETVK